MKRGEFTFGAISMMDTYGIILRQVNDVIQPQLRERKVIVPERSGAYDFGARYYDERILELDCYIVKPVDRAFIREVSYTLSEKNQIRVWQEPDKYYIGRLYDPASLERVGTIQRHFTLPMVCEPFAYGEIVSEDFGEQYIPEYAATHWTPTRIEITNIGTTDAVGIQITVQERG